MIFKLTLRSFCTRQVDARLRIPSMFLNSLKKNKNNAIRPTSICNRRNEISHRWQCHFNIPGDKSSTVAPGPLEDTRVATACGGDEGRPEYVPYARKHSFIFLQIRVNHLDEHLNMFVVYVVAELGFVAELVFVASSGCISTTPCCTVFHACGTPMGKTGA